MSTGVEREVHDGATTGRAARCARVAFALLAALACTAARAERLRMLVLVAGEPQRELAARIKGQTGDLEAVVGVAEGGLPGDLDRQAALVRAARSRADVVVWFAVDPNGDWVASIARGDRVLVRRIAVAPGALSRSASIEAVALAVRTALTGFVAVHDAEEAERRSRTVRPWGAIGGTGLLDGTGTPGRLGAALRLGVARGRWHLGAAAGLQQSTAAEAGQTSIAVQRLDGGVVLGLDLFRVRKPGAGAWNVALELGLGAARYRRVTGAAAPGLVPTEATARWSPLVAPGVRAASAVFPGGWLAVEAGADVLTRPPEFGVQRASGFERLASVWAVQPRIALSLLLDWR